MKVFLALVVTCILFEYNLGAVPPGPGPMSAPDEPMGLQREFDEGLYIIVPRIELF